MVRKITFFVFCTSIIFSSSIYSQVAKTLTIDESLDYALKNSYSIKNYELEMIRQKKSILSWEAALKSSGWFSAVLPEFNESITQEFNTEEQYYEFYKLKSLGYSGTFSINQPIPSNGRFSINSTGLRLSQFDSEPDYTSSLFVQFNQPIFTPNALKREFYKAGLSYKSAELRYIQNRLNNIYRRVSSNFTDLIRRKMLLENYEWKYKSLEKIKDIAETKFEYKEIEEMSFLQINVELSMAKDQHLSRITDFERRKEEFKQLIGIPIDEDFEIISEIFVDRICPDMKLAVRKAIENDISLKSGSIRVELDSIEVEEKDIENEFKGNIELSYGLNNTDKSISKLFKNFDKTAKVKINFHLPLWDWGRNNDRVKAAYIDYVNTKMWLEEIKKQKVNSVNNYLVRIRTALELLEINEKLLEISKEMYDISLEKFENNEISSEDLILIIDKVVESKNSYINAIINLEDSFTNLNSATLWDFKKNRPLFQNIENEISDIEKRAYEENNW